MTSRKPMAHLLPTLYFHSTISHQRQLHQLHHCTPNCRNHNSITSLTAKTNNSTCQTIIEAGSDLDTERAPINAYTYLKNVHITVCLLNMVLISSKFLDFLLCILSYTQIHRAYNQYYYPQAKHRISIVIPRPGDKICMYAPFMSKHIPRSCFAIQRL